MPVSNIWSTFSEALLATGMMQGAGSKERARHMPPYGNSQSSGETKAKNQAKGLELWENVRGLCPTFPGQEKSSKQGNLALS